MSCNCRRLGGSPLSPRTIQHSWDANTKLHPMKIDTQRSIVATIEYIGPTTISKEGVSSTLVDIECRSGGQTNTNAHHRSACRRNVFEGSGLHIVRYIDRAATSKATYSPGVEMVPAASFSKQARMDNIPDERTRDGSDGGGDNGRGFALPNPQAATVYMGGLSAWRTKQLIGLDFDRIS
jgi:hypothetical protein